MAPITALLVILVIELLRSRLGSSLLKKLIVVVTEFRDEVKVVTRYGGKGSELTPPKICTYLNQG